MEKKQNLECSGKVQNPDRTETNVIIERFSGLSKIGKSGPQKIAKNCCNTIIGEMNLSHKI